MIRTATQTLEQTLTRLIRAMDAQHPVTITYLEEERDENRRRTGNLVETVRTIEIFDARPTKAGDLLVIAMDRETAEVRSWRIDRIVAFTIHRSARYTVALPDETDTPAQPSLRLAEAVIADRCPSPLATREHEERRHIAMLTDLLAAA
ncbi:hypothetical protein [Kitasatospora sp. CMC57]|uniref:hypothetical protein n=1 Tax=Kitasatospora sp. CMC57 TaxID=3231513 RepID=UPI0038B4F1D4